MFGWLFGKKLEDVVKETKVVRLHGIRFVIRKVNMMNYIDGSKVLIQAFDTHKTKGQKKAALEQATSNKVQSHLSDVIIAGVVNPKLCRPGDKDGISVDEIFTDWGLAYDLYNEILTFTYGKKKARRATSAANEWLKSMQ